MKRLAVPAVALLALVLAGCQSTPAPVVAAAPPAAKPLPLQPPAASQDAFMASGPIVVENQLDVAAQRDGVIAELDSDAGTRVRKGQVLAKLDDRQLTADRDAAKNQADSIESDLKNWEATVKMAQVDLDRSEKMFAEKLITASQLDHDRFKLTATKYEFDREGKNYQRAVDVVKSLNLELEKTRVTAPFDGVVARRYVHNGQRVANGDRLFWVTALGPMHVRFTVPEKFAKSIRRDTPLELTPTDWPDEKHAGRVLLVSPVVDPGSGTFDVTAEFVGATGELKPGMVVNVRLKNQP